jgi:hypothetical protein
MEDCYQSCQEGNTLSKVGDVKADVKSMQAQATNISSYICVAYVKLAEPCTPMTEFRVKIWRSKAGKSGTPLVKLCSLPPPNNICHLQVAIWRAALLKSPLTMDPTNQGWELDHQGIRLPRTVPTGTLSASADILNLIHCNCKTSGCLTAACSYSKTRVGRHVSTL